MTSDRSGCAMVAHRSWGVLRLSFLPIALISCLLIQDVAAQNAWREDFEGTTTSWRWNHAAGLRLDGQQRFGDSSRDGNGCEGLRITATNAGYANISHRVPAAPVIDELIPSVSIRSGSNGAQMMVRVVLPRARDPQTGQPLTVLVRGPTYSRIGQWERLTMGQLSRALAGEVRMLRTRIEGPVDPREAYVDQVVLSVHATRGATDVWIDDLELAGLVTDVPRSTPYRSATARSSPYEPRAAKTPVKSARRVRLQGSMLSINGQPFFPRMIQYQGEPLSWLRQIGFNTARLATPPSGSLLDEAARAGMWLVCPPPNRDQLAAISGNQAGSVTIPPAYDVVLAWDLGHGLSKRDLESFRLASSNLRQSNRRASRPILCEAESQLRAFSRYANILETSRRPIGTTLELADYARWLQHRPRLARPGTPTWTMIQTQYSPALRRQLSVLAPGSTAPGIEADQIRLMVYAALSSGVRAIGFDSDSRLDAQDSITYARARTLELLNLELSLVEPWAATGNYVTSVSSNDPQASAVVIENNQARLLVPMHSNLGDQYVASPSRGGTLSLVVPGVSQSSQAFRLTPGGLPPLRRRRVTGGTLVPLENFSLTDLVVLTQDARAIRALQQRATAIGVRAAQLQYEIAAERRGKVAAIDQQLARSPVSASLGPKWLQAAADDLAECQRLLANRSTAQREAVRIYQLASRAMQPLRQLERAHWKQAASQSRSPASNPSAVTFATLPLYWKLTTQIRAARLGPNRLYGGDFENLSAMQQVGWSHTENPQTAVQADVQLVPTSRNNQRLSVRLRASPLDPRRPPALVESPPVWITSAPVAIEAGELLRIHGRIRVPNEITGSVDRLMIVDSLGGPSLAARIGRTEGWQEFTLYRAAPQSGQMTVTFALTGLGEAWIDDVTVRKVAIPAAPLQQSRHGPPLFGPPLTR